jgi:hypothetical protein
MKKGFKPKSFTNYNLTPEEQKELDKILGRNFGKRIYLTIPVASSVTFLLCQKKG